MSNQDNHTCEYCGKKYANLYVLAKHQQTAKFCLELQQKTKADIMYECNFCTMSFTLKSIYDKHLIVCKEKKKIEEEQKQTVLKTLAEEFQELKIKYSVSLQKIESLTEQLAEKNKQMTEQLAEKNKQIDQLTSTIQEKDKYIQESTKVTNIYNTNQNTAQYNLNIQTEFEKLTPFTDENVKMKVRSIPPINLIEFNNYNLMQNFQSNFGRALSDMAILTDKARGLLLVKNKDGNQQKYQSKALILDALTMAEDDCKQLFNRTTHQLNHLELYGDIMPEDQTRAQNDLTLLYYYLVHKTMDKTVQGISSVLNDNCVYISKRLPNQLTISDTDQSKLIS